MPQFATTVAEVVRLSTVLAGAYLTVGLVLVAAQAHWAVVAGQPVRAALAPEGAFAVVMCFGVAVSAASLASEIAQVASGAPVVDGSSAAAVWQILASLVVRTVILSVGASLAIGIATGAASAQLAVLIGQPRAASALWTRLALTVLTAVLTLASVPLAEALLRMMLQP
jgi:hypothetical protein